MSPPIAAPTVSLTTYMAAVPTDMQRFQGSIFFRNSLNQRMDNPITAIPELPEGGHGAVIGIPRALGGRAAHEHGHGGHQNVPVHGPH